MACGEQSRGPTRPSVFQQPLPCREGAVGFSGSISRRWSPEWRPRLAEADAAVTAHVGRSARLSQRCGPRASDRVVATILRSLTLRPVVQPPVLASRTSTPSL
jgi:hypothetical protein